MLSKILLTAAALAATSQIVVAADLPARAPNPAKIYSPAPVVSWTGIYVGGNIGYGWASGTDEITATGGITGTVSAGDKLKGMLGGGQIGYNWQTGNFVLGVETDFQGSGQTSNTNIGSIGTTNFSLEDKINWFGTTRLRAGVVTANNWLLYGTGGIAYFGGTQSLTATGGTVGTVSRSFTKPGWTVGAGLELPIANNWTGKIEYLYWQSNWTETATISTITLTEKFKLSDSIVRVGANYRF